MLRTSFWIWLIVIFTPALVGGDYPLYGVQRNVYCTQAQIAKERPAADILFVGNSQVASGIDAVFLGRVLGKRVADGVTVEKLIDLGPLPAKFYLDTEAYFAERGSPRLLVLNLPINLRSADSAMKSGLYSSKTIKTHDLESLLRAKFAYGTESHQQEAAWLGWMRWLGEYPAIVVKKLGDNFYKPLKASVLPEEARKGCKGDDVYPSASNPNYYPHGDLEVGKDYHASGELRVMKKRTKSEQMEFSLAMYPPDLLSPDREVEYYFIQRILDLCRRNDVPVLTTYVPVLGWQDLGGRAAEVFNTRLDEPGYVDSFQIYAMEETQQYGNETFRNWNHMNFNGAHLLSLYWADVLSDNYNE